MTINLCPCGSQNLYESCCGYFHLEKGYPASAEALMRSRYSAFVLKNKQYLLKTWHKSKRPKDLDFALQIEWLGLKIVSTEAGLEMDNLGKVEFVAEYKTGLHHGKLHEISNFIKENSRWFYLDGKILND